MKLFQRQKLLRAVRKRHASRGQVAGLYTLDFIILLFSVKPQPLQNCTAQNQSGTWIRISCVEGSDGGLPQKFVAVLDEQRWESSSPYWEIEIHKPATVALYALNAKGASEPIIMEGIAFKDVAKFTGEQDVRTRNADIGILYITYT